MAYAGAVVVNGRPAHGGAGAQARMQQAASEGLDGEERVERAEELQAEEQAQQDVQDVIDRTAPPATSVAELVNVAMERNRREGHEFSDYDRDLIRDHMNFLSEPGTPLNELRQRFDNFIPLSEVRRSPEMRSLTRAQQDRRLFSGQDSDRWDFSTLLEAGDFPAHQQLAGIPQAAGGPIFFLQFLD